MWGIGPYTASAVLASVCGRVEPPIDVNMAWVLGRFFGSQTGSERSRNLSLQALLCLVVIGEDSLRVNWAILDFAALVCKARCSLCQQCLLRTECRYFNGNTTLLPL